MKRKHQQETPLTIINTPPSGALYDPSIPSPSRLIGREKEVSELRQRLQGRGNMALTALHGLPGVGKTALLIALAHDPELQTYFKDGILWAGLGPSSSIHSHLSRWGTLLGFSQAEMSTFKDEVDWALALRRRIGMRHILLIIDDAWTLEEALALKVGGPNCVHLMSTRFPALATEATVNGAKTIEELDNDDGVALLRMLAPDFVESEMQRARGLVTAVGGLPLALTLIGNYLRLQSDRGLAQGMTAALQKLSDASERLNLSDPHNAIGFYPGLAKETPISLRTVIAVTDQQLTESYRRALHALSVFPPRPNSFTEEAALAIGACAAETLDELIDSGLLEINGANRYSLHQTIADYARSQLKDDSAHQRLIVYISAFAEAHRKDYDTLESETRNILAALEAAVQQAHYAKLTCIAVAFAPFLLARGLYSIAETYLQHAHNAAISITDHTGLTGVLLHLGEMAWKRGNLEQAEKYLQEGLNYAREAEDDERICAILANLGSVSWKHGEYSLARAYLQEGLILARELQNQERMCELFQILGSVERMQGDYRQAEASLQEGLKLARSIEERELTCPILLNLGAIAAEQGNYHQAEDFFQEGLQLARQLRHDEWLSAFLNNLGDSASEQEDYEQAMAYFQEGLLLARRIEHREWISFLLLNLGLTSKKQKNYTLSKSFFQESLALARQVGIPQITCHVLYGYGELHLDQRSLIQAEAHFREMISLAPEGGQDFIALALYGLARLASIDGRLAKARQLGEQSALALEQLGRREAGEVKSWLRTLSSK